MTKFKEANLTHYPLPSSVASITVHNGCLFIAVLLKNGSRMPKIF